MSFLLLLSAAIASPWDQPCAGQKPHPGFQHLQQVCPNSTPPKPRGIYVLVPWSKPSKAEWLEQPFVDGLTVRIYWKDLEPEPGKYDWTMLDKHFELARAANKKLRLAVTGGGHAPAWLRTPEGGTAECKPGVDRIGSTPKTAAKGVIQLACASMASGPNKPEVGRWFPSPFDATYRTEWNTFVEALAAHMDKKDQLELLSWIAVTGPNSHNGEVSHSNDLPWEGLKDLDQRPVIKRIEGEAVIKLWNEEVARFDRVFGAKGIHYTVSFVYKTWGKRGNKGQDWDFKRSLVEAADKLPHGKYYGIQTNGLDAAANWAVCHGEEPLKKFDEGGGKRHWRLIADHGCKNGKAGGLTGFQVRASNNLYKADDSPCGHAKVWATLLDTIRGTEVDFVEVYPADVMYDKVDPKCQAGDQRSILKVTHNWLVGG